MSDQRKFRFQGQELGIFPIDRLYRMASRGEINHTAEFWSERENSWRPLAGIIFDLDPPNTNNMKSAGIAKVKILGSGSHDCPACRALGKKVYLIDDVPTLPPANCTCVPWCRSIVIAQNET
jgi:hypothetical protein